MNETLNDFHKLVEDQFKYGGKKYGRGQAEQREATDLLFDTHGFRWLIGTIDKYTYRYQNLKRERDLLKIACYMYILWLKRGFHILARGSKKTINTNVKIKEENFSKFVGLINSSEYINYTIVNPISTTHLQCLLWSEGNFKKITEEEILSVYSATYLEWAKVYYTVYYHDTDTSESTTFSDAKHCQCSNKRE